MGNMDSTLLPEGSQHKKSEELWKWSASLPSKLFPVATLQISQDPPRADSPFSLGGPLTSFFLWKLFIIIQITTTINTSSLIRCVLFAKSFTSLHVFQLNENGLALILPNCLIS